VSFAYGLPLLSKGSHGATAQTALEKKKNKEKTIFAFIKSLQIRKGQKDNLK
jgi:hypothetical protein